MTTLPARCLLLASLSLLLGACAAAPTRAGTPAAGASKPFAGAPRKAARDAIDNLVSNYAANDSTGFLALLDDQSFSDFQAVTESFRDYLRDNKEINLDVILDNAVENEGRLAATIHWNKSLVTNAGQQVLSNGSGELVFRRDVSGRLLLTGIHGQSPF